MTRFALLVAALLVAVTGFGSAVSHAAAAEQYVPFVTDFPKTSEPYVPFVSDFPRPAATPTPAAKADASWIDWGAISLEGGLGVSIATLLTAAALFLVRRRHAGPRLTGR